jgi:hypothetical protein
MVESFLATKGPLTRMIIYVSDDDSSAIDYEGMLPLDGDIKLIFGPRRYIAEVYNKYSSENIFDYYANLNDDHFFVTPNWDSKLISIVEERGNGWGIACAADKLTDWTKHPHPSGCVISGKMTRVLGWIAPPGTRHIGIDVIQGRICKAIGRLFLAPEIVIEHRHWVNGMRPMDENYRWVYGREEQEHGDNAVTKYLYGQFNEDVKKLKEAIENEKAQKERITG